VLDRTVQDTLHTKLLPGTWFVMVLGKLQVCGLPLTPVVVQGG